MCSPSSSVPRLVAHRVSLVGLAALSLLLACDREQRRLRESPPSMTPAGVVRVSELQPGTPLDTTRHVRNPYENNAYAISEGQRLFGWYNCAGCHANGGGGMGPPLMDDKWIYGGAPENIYATIIEGRPNGMPSFAGKIPTSQVWEIVAYVRSLSGLTPSAARSSRADHMMMYPGSQSLSRAEKAKWSFRPPAAEGP
jgi:cytochrome c oxidase cbb3-type subunit 3